MKSVCVCGLLFQLCRKPQWKNVNSAFESHWSQASNHKNRYNRWYNLITSIIKKQSRKPQFQVAIPLFYHIASRLSSVLCAIDIEWVMRFSCFFFVSNTAGSIILADSRTLKCLFFSPSLLLLLLLLLLFPQYKQHKHRTQTLLNRKSISINWQRARIVCICADSHKIPRLSIHES